MLRLLPKSEVDKRKAQEKFRELQEGEKLAARVDSLREMVASEEAVFATYHQETLKKIQDDLQARYAQRDALDAEIEQRRQERARLLVPLDSRQHELDDFQRKLEARADELGQKEFDLSVRERVARQKEEKVAKDMQLAHDIAEKSQIARREAQNMLATAREDAAEMRNEAQRVIFEAENKLKSAEIKEKSLLIREREVQLVKANNLKVRRANIAEQIRLADMRKTLERALKRI